MATPQDPLPADDLPTALVREQRWPSPVWLVPLAALLIGLWLLFQNWYERGPTIVVQFANAEGIQPGKTEVRYRAVTVGKVKQLQLDDDLKNVNAIIELNKEIGRHLGSDARFWVVRPRISRTEISGLTTVFSGSYIGMDPGTDSNASRFYTGDERPPVVTPAENGKRFFLFSETLGSLDIGSPVFYKQLAVGEVIDYELSKDKGHEGKVRIEIFIREPYADYVRDNTQFWNASGLEVSVNADGAEMRMQSFLSFLIGGIAFDTPIPADAGNVSTAGASFTLRRNYKEAQTKQFAEQLFYVMHFEGSVSGLTIGSPVQYEGIPIGRVEKIGITLDRHSLQAKVPVLVSIQPQHFDERLNREEAKELMQQLVAKGLRARLQMASFITGQKVIVLGMEKDPKPARIQETTQFYGEFPTTAGSTFDNLPLLAAQALVSLDETLGNINRILSGIKLDKTVGNLNTVLEEAATAVKAARDVLVTVDSKTLPSVQQDISKLADDLGKTMQKLQGSLGQLDRLTAPHSPTQHQLQEMLEEVTTAARSLRELTDTLQRQPTAPLRGKQEDAR